MLLMVFVGNQSWILPYAEKLTQWFNKQGLEDNLIRNKNDLNACDVTFLIGCIKLVNLT